MTDKPYNPNDPAFLASRSLDEELSAADQKRLDDALAASDALRAELKGLRAIDGLVGKWGSGEAELDWVTHCELVQASVLAEHDHERDRKLGELLESWAGDRAEIDDEAFTAAVMAKVQAQSHRTPRRSLIFRLGTPLAAAAAIALVVTSSLMDWSSPVPRVEVSFVRGPATADPTAEPTRVAVVSFRRERGVDFAPEPTSSGISFMVVGASPSGQDLWNEAPPL